MPDPDFMETNETSVHWYRCKNPACRRWFNIYMLMSGMEPGHHESQASQMNLHLMFCPMCGHKPKA